MNEERARIINVTRFSKKETGEMFARMTYSIKVSSTDKMIGSAVLNCFIPVDKFDTLKNYVDKEVPIVIENRPGQNGQLIAKLTKVGNEKLS